MNHPRYCSKPGCRECAVTTLTYDYADSMLVIGPLARQPEPFTYDLCQQHVERLTAPQGWQVVRLHTRFDEAPLSASDPEALLKAIQEPLETPEPLGTAENGETLSGAEDRAPAQTSGRRRLSEETAPVIDSPEGASTFTATVTQLPLPHARAVSGSERGERVQAPEYGPFTSHNDEV